MSLVGYPSWLLDSEMIIKDTLDWLQEFKDYSCRTSMREGTETFGFFVDYTSKCLEDPIYSDTALAAKHLDEACTSLISQLPLEKQPEFTYRVLRMNQHLDKAVAKHSEIFKVTRKEKSSDAA